MCGICGIFHFDDSAPDKQLLESMKFTLQRRGPDAEGSWFAGPVAFGHRRLAVIDLSAKSSQPMVDPVLNLTLVFNGTIYNYPQLRAQLQDKGYQFFSDGDTEVILKAYAEWGEQCVEHLHGMFAFALWNANNQELFLARDRLGIKPLYYSNNGKRFLFASNTQAILQDKSVDRSLDPVGLHHQFTLHGVVPAPYTVIKGIRKLPPAHTMTLRANGEQRLRQYWFLRAQRPPQPKSEWEWAEEVRACLVEAVRKRKTIADVPVGVLLSGGLDSSLLVGLLKEAGVDDLLTFSVGFEDQPEEKGSEFEYSDLVAAQHHTRHHKFSIPNNQVLQRLPEAVTQMAEPMFGQDAIGFYLLSEQVAKYVKVVQSGQGADEVFGGYFWYPQMQQATGSDLQRFANHYFDRDQVEYAQMISSDYVDRDFTSETIGQALQQGQADTFMDQVLRLDVTTLIVDDPVKRVDNMTMAFGLEARVPFLDHHLVELVAQIPSELKIKNGGKNLLKIIARGLIPDAVIDRPKGYFPVPALKYVRGEFLDFMRDILNTDACRNRGLYQRAYVEKLLANPEQHLTRILGSKLWHLAVFELWLQKNI